MSKEPKPCPFDEIKITCPTCEGTGVVWILGFPLWCEYRPRRCPDCQGRGIIYVPHFPDDPPCIYQRCKERVQKILRKAWNRPAGAKGGDR